MILPILLICLLAIGAVSATQNVTDDVITVDDINNVVSIEKTNNDNNIENNKTLMAGEENQEKLSFTNVKEDLSTSEYQNSYQSDNEDSSNHVLTKLTTKVTVKNIKGYENKKVKITAIIKDKFGKKIKSGKAIIKFKGKNYKVSVKNGKATKTIKIPKTNNRGIFYKYPKGRCLI